MSLLNYIKQIWDTTSYVNPTRMNHIEEGIYAVSNKVDNLSADDIPYDNNNSVKDMITVNSFTPPTINTSYLSLTGSATTCQKYGKLVLFKFFYNLTNTVPDTQPILFSNLPEPKEGMNFIVYRRSATGDLDAFRINLNTSGEAKYWYNGKSLSANSSAIEGIMIYLTN